MTLEQAKEMDCPYKPRSVDLFTGQSLSKCTGSPCMCWVEITEPTYLNITNIAGTYKDKHKFLDHHTNYKCTSTKFNYFDCEHNSNNTYTFGIPNIEPQGYCTLRGDV